MQRMGTVGHIHGALVSCAGPHDGNGRLGPGPKTVKNIYRPKDDALVSKRIEYLAVWIIVAILGLALVVSLSSK